MKYAIIVGHTAKAKGAYSHYLNCYEYDWNLDFAKRIGLEYATRDAGGLSLAHKKLEHTDGTIELHLNALNGKATGTETLYVTENSRELAELVHKTIISVLGIRDRGVKKLSPNDRGFQNLSISKKPCILIEPAFMDNRIDCLILIEKKVILAKALRALSD